MRMLRWFGIKNVREFFWSGFFLATALLLAILSQIAEEDGERYAATFLAILSLIFAFIVCVTLVPKLVVRIKLDFLNSLQSFRFTQRGAFFVLIILVIALSTLNTGNNLLILILSVLLASLVVSGLVSNLVLHDLKISLTIPNSIHARQKALFFFDLRNLKKFFPSFALRLKGRSEEGMDSRETDFFVQEKYFPYLQAGESSRLRMSCEFDRRGAYTVDGFEVTTTFPFGFFARGRKLEARAEIVVYPALLDLSPLFLRCPALHGFLEQNRKGPGSTLYSIRDYQVGDSARFVHWKSTAKVARLMIKDFAHEEENPIQVVFSSYLPERSAAALEQFEKAVSYIASLAYYCGRKGRGLRFSSGEFQVALSGREEEMTALMWYLSHLEPSDEVQVRMDQLMTPCVLFTASESVSTQEVYVVNYLKL